MKTKSIKKLSLQKKAVANLTKQQTESVKGGNVTTTTTSIFTVFCNSFVAGEDYRVCFAEQ